MSQNRPIIEVVNQIHHTLGYQLSIQPLVDENADLVPTTDKPGMTNTTAHLSEEPAVTATQADI